MPGAATDLFDLANRLLGVCAAALAQLPAGCPDRRYVGHGLPALDCEQLVVSTYQVPEADTAPMGRPLDRAYRAVYMSHNTVYLVVSIVRCYPTIKSANGREVFPSVGELTAASITLYEDGWQLWNAIKSAKRAEQLGPLREAWAMDPMLPLQPSGGYAGWTIPIEAQLDGFTVALP